MKKTYARWKDIRHKAMSPERARRLDREVAEALLEMDLQAIRELTGKTQTEVGAPTAMTQSEVSRLEHREDYLLSTLRRYVEALGGELEVIASFGDRRVRLHAAR